MEPDTVSTPKINKSTFSFGGSLMKRVSNNERKITVLKNIIRTRRNNIGEKITPKMSSLQESLMVTNEVLVDIARQLEQDFDSRVVEKKSLLQKNRAEKLEIRRQQVLEEKAENKQTEKTVKTAARKTIKPLGNIFGKVFELIKILGTGILVNAVVGNFDKIIGFFSGDTFKNIQAKFTQAYQLINKHMGLIVAVGAGLIALSLVGTISNIIAVGTGLLKIVTNPVFIAGVALLYGLPKLFNMGLDKVEEYYKNDPTGEKNYVGDKIPGAPTDANPGDYFIDGNKHSTIGNQLRCRFQHSNPEIPMSSKNEWDTKLSGDYLIYRTRHIIKKERYDMAHTMVKMGSFPK